ncbi:MAG: hypothetical protein ABI167_01385 [Nitrosospira sp.]
MKIIATLLLLTVIAGCSTVGGNKESSGMAALECGAVGAGVATAICMAAGGSAAMCAGAGTGGALLGAGACYTFAESYKKRRQELAGKENDLDARLIYVRGLNEDSKKSNEELNKKVVQASKRTDKVVAQIKAGTISQQELAKEREGLLKEEKVANNQAALEKSALEDMKRFQAEQKRKTGVDSAASTELDKEIEKQQHFLEETQRQTSALASQRQRI